MVDQTRVVKPDVYEAGLQVWECSLDLVCYLHQCLFWNDDNSSLSGKPQHAQYEDTDPRNLPECVDGPWLQSLLFGGSHNNEEDATTTTVPPTESAGHTVPKILELGCGNAVPGIYLLRWCWLQQLGLKQESMTCSMQRLPQLHVCEYNTPNFYMPCCTRRQAIPNQNPRKQMPTQLAPWNNVLTDSLKAYTLERVIDWVSPRFLHMGSKRTTGSEGPSIISDTKRKKTIRMNYMI